jgi:hypothetical protein
VEDIKRVARADVEVEKPFSLIVETPHRSYYVVANSEQGTLFYRYLSLYPLFSGGTKSSESLNHYTFSLYATKCFLFVYY